MTVTIDDITAAARRLDGRVRATPVLTVGGVQLQTAGTVSLKLEYLQHSGSFKGRGAMHFMVSNAISDAGVIAASGGNHGAAVAWAARELGHQANIFVPTISAPVKVDRLRSYGAVVHQVGDVYADALAASARLATATGATPIHAYEAPAVVAGAGTTGLELQTQLQADRQSPADTVLVACGGGGLAAGIAAAIGHRTQVVACETEQTAAYGAALKAGQPTPIAVGGVAADALGATQIGDLAFRLLTAADAQSVIVTDDEVTEAQRFMWDHFRMITEPAAAVPVAAVLTGKFRPAPSAHTAVVVCGANTNPALVPSGQ